MSTERALISGGDVLVGDPLNSEVRRTDLLVEDGVIIAIGDNLSGVDAERISARGRWVIPGFVDAHRHLWQTTMRSVTANWNLNDYFWCIRNNHAGLHTADDIYAGQFAGALDALSAGVTTTIDFSHNNNSPEHSDQAVRGVLDAGIRALWCYGYYDAPRKDPAFTTWAQRAADVRRIKETYFSVDGLVRMGVALNELGLVPLAQTRNEIELAAELDARVTMHTSCIWNPRYQIADVTVLHAAGLLREGQLHSHSNACTDEELDLLRDHGCSVSSTPDTELQMACGVPIFRRALERGVNAGIGADIVSNNSGDMFTPMRILMQHERGYAHQWVLESVGLPAVTGVPVTTRQVLHAATLAGARALGLESVCGSVSKGKAADLLFLRNDSLTMRPVIDPIDSMVMQATTRDIDRVMVAGRTVVSDGRLPSDQERRGTELIEAAHERLAQRVHARGGWKIPVPPDFWERFAPVMVENVATDRTN